MVGLRRREPRHVFYSKLLGLHHYLSIDYVSFLLGSIHSLVCINMHYRVVVVHIIEPVSVIAAFHGVDNFVQTESWWC